MGGLNVKNTMVERVLQIVAPHPCSGCGKVGTILCEDCKYDIINEPFSGCILCGSYTLYGICEAHASPITRAFTVGTRSGALEELINRLKFHYAKAAARPLADLFNEVLPLLPDGSILTFVPTVRAHIRERGYDHIGLVATYFSLLREMPLTSLLRRRTKITQHTATREARQLQVVDTFEAMDGVDIREKVVLLLDDVVTTGATLQAAALKLVGMGATVWVATLAYQPLD
ncbi:hypothetical protein BGO17_04105 [Candidatus Saccharibacteria bacterium 49-20]|nr:MAG: hypothetical protein BGO17_04105 [Candidatus Saccharibacteria bacterium 49-20]